MLRFILGAVRADFYNPVSQFLVRITNPLLVPMRRIIPSIRQYDTSALLLMLVLQLVSLVIVTMLRGISVPFITLLLVSIGELVILALNIFLFAIVIQVVLSWINPGSYNPINALLYSLTSPVLGPIQRIIPSISGIDLSPLVALIALQVLKMLVLPLLG
jgi:YggT family protein